MYCSKCGTKLEVGQVFCINCGNKNENQTNIENSNITQNNPITQVENTIENQTSKMNDSIPTMITNNQNNNHIGSIPTSDIATADSVMKQAIPSNNQINQNINPVKQNPVNGTSNYSSLNRNSQNTLFVIIGILGFIIVVLLVIFIIIPFFSKKYYTNEEIVCRLKAADQVEDDRNIVVASFENNKLKLAMKHIVIKFKSNDLAKSFYDLTADTTFGTDKTEGWTLNNNEVVSIQFYDVTSTEEQKIMDGLDISSIDVSKESFITTYKNKGYKCSRK